MIKVTLLRKDRGCVMEAGRQCNFCLTNRAFGRAVKKKVWVYRICTNSPEVCVGGKMRTYVLPRTLSFLIDKLDSCTKVTFYAKNLKEASHE